MRPTKVGSDPTTSAGVGHSPAAGSSRTTMPGASTSAWRVASAVSGLSKTACTASEWVVMTGTRTQVAETLRSGMPRILRDSLRTLSSSELQPPSLSEPAHGTTLRASGAGNGEAPPGVQRPECVDHRQCRAVGVADDALGAVADLGGVDLGHDQRNLRIHPEGTGVVNRDGPVRHRDRGPLGRYVVRHVEHRDVDPVEGLRSDLLNHDILTADLQNFPGRARGGEQANFAPDVRTLTQDAEHDGADSASRTDDGQGGLAIAHRPVPP